MELSKKEQKRDLILKTVSRIVNEEGMEKLTLEHVAKQANISKGGLLYHFPNKEALIFGLVDQLSDTYVKRFHASANEDSQVQGRWTRSYIQTSCSDPSGENDLYTLILAAYFTNPEMLQRLRQFYSDAQNKIENDGIDPVESTIVRLAIDGLWFAEMFGLAPLASDLKEKVLKQLITNLQEVK